MSLKVHLECARHHVRAFEFFNFSSLDAFHNADVLSVVHGRDWRSVLITDGRDAWLHAFAKTPIGETGHFDVDPFLGYAGPVATTPDRRFIEAALQTHAEVCRAEKIIAEVFRFNPLLGNHAAFDGTATRVVRAKDIIIATCAADEGAQMRTFTKSCRSSVRRGLRDLAFEALEGASGMDAFASLYRRSLGRLDSEAKWYFPDAFFARARLGSRRGLRRSRRRRARLGRARDPPPGGCVLLPRRQRGRPDPGRERASALRDCAPGLCARRPAPDPRRRPRR